VTAGTTVRRVIARLWWLFGVALMAAGALVVMASARAVDRLGPVVAEPAGVVTVVESDRRHVEGSVRYDRVPPAGGPHYSIWLNCGVYDRPVPNEFAVHSLEHGAVWITYRPSLDAGEVERLRAVVRSSYDGLNRYVILSPYPALPAAIVATAWGHQLSLAGAGDPRLAQFIAHFRQGPQDLELGAPCLGGFGAPIG